MDDTASGTDAARGHGIGGNARQYYKRDFWGKENLKFVEPHFRLEKAARIINNTARGRECDLLDVGCGPATLKRLLGENVHYHGIDIAIHDPAPNLSRRTFSKRQSSLTTTGFLTLFWRRASLNMSGVSRTRNFPR